MMRLLSRYLTLLFILAAILSGSGIAAQTNTVTYQKNTEHELTIFFINGKEPGGTMMIIGGIQGDEPGGYLAADLYADIQLEKGNLIVVPRANFNAIIRNMRGVNGDMNRKFSSSDTRKYDRDIDIVEVLQNLIMKSDVLLNLHEGSGFYHPTYISDLRNPMRYGQSIIADAATYIKKNGEIIDLASPVNRVIDAVNSNIKNPDHHFKFNNHQTMSENTRHAEQRKSATYFALTESEIPAFGIETSKNISDTVIKVKYQSLVINAFMAEYGIVPEHPSVSIPVPELDHLVIRIIGSQNPLAVKNNDTIQIPAGSSIHVESVVANYKRGLSIDILNAGGTNDLGRVIVINNSTTINVFKDAYRCGSVGIETTPDNTPKQPPVANILPAERLKHLEIEVAGKNLVVSADDTLHIVRGDIMKITSALTTNFSDTGFRVNFVGFVGNTRYNDAEDRGYRIDTARDLMTWRSLNSEQSLYRIAVENLETKSEIGSTYIVLDEPAVDYVIVRNESGATIALKPGATVDCRNMETFTVLSVISNVTGEPAVETYTENGAGQAEKLALPAQIEISSETALKLMRSSDNIGTITFRTRG